jgi:hypothetical protein
MSNLLFGGIVTDALSSAGAAMVAFTVIYVHHVPQVDAAKKLSVVLREASTPPLAMVGSGG